MASVGRQQTDRRSMVSCTGVSDSPGNKPHYHRKYFRVDIDTERGYLSSWAFAQQGRAP